MNDSSLSDNDEADDEHDCCCRSLHAVARRKRCAKQGSSNRIPLKRQRPESVEWNTSEFESEDTEEDEVSHRLAKKSQCVPEHSSCTLLNGGFFEFRGELFSLSHG